MSDRSFSAMEPLVDDERTIRVPVQAQLVEQRGPAESRVFLLQGEVTRIGRNADNDIVLPSPAVSRYHAELRNEGGRYLVHDLGSRNGTILNGEQISGPQPLERGDRITIGDQTLLFQTDETVEARAVLRAGETLRVDTASAQVWVGERLIRVTAQEYRALVLLYNRQGELVSKEELASQIWPEYGGDVSDETLAQLITRLRRKLEPDPRQVQYLLTVRGLGYRLLPDGSPAP